MVLVGLCLTIYPVIVAVLSKKPGKYKLEDNVFHILLVPMSKVMITNWELLFIHIWKVLNVKGQYTNRI